jgi:hypothetical protein
MMDTQTSPDSFTNPLRSQLATECEVMLQYALSSGKELPQPIRDTLEVLDRESQEEAGLASLAALHGALLRVVAPATPGGLAMIQEDRRNHRKLHILGPVPSIRYLMLVAVGFSLLFFGTSLSSEINAATIGQDIFNSSGPQLAWVLIFLLSASGLGATFGALFDIYQYISDGSYDTKFDSIYWARIGLGLISGLMLAELIPQVQNSGTGFERPLLALLGGFSASVVHRILERLVSALESIFIPGRKDDPVANEREIRQRVTDEQAQQRSILAQSFDQLLDHVASGGDIADARKGLVSILAGQSGPLAGLTDKAQRVAVDAAVGLATGGLKGAGQRVLADITGGGGSVGDMVAGAVFGKGGGGVLGAIAGPVVDSLLGGGTSGGSSGNGVASLVGAALGAATGGSTAAADSPFPASAIGSIAKALGGAVVGGTPAGLVLALVTIGVQLGTAEYDRWVARVLGTPYRPDLLPPESLTADSAIAALRLTPICGRAFKPELDQEDRLTLETCARLAAGPDDGFMQAYASRFASRDECEAGLWEFRQVLLDRQVTDDAAPLLPANGLNATDMLKAVDASRGDPAAAAGLQAVMATVSQGRNEGWDEQKTLDAAYAVQPELAHA